jgi:hypothetical protein
MYVGKLLIESHSRPRSYDRSGHSYSLSNLAQCVSYNCNSLLKLVSYDLL